jgi:hypothetical protein
MHRKFPSQGLSKYSEIRIFGMKVYNPATQVGETILSEPALRTYILWKILLLFIWIGSDPSFFPPIFHCPILSTNLLTPPIYFHWSDSITVLPFIYHCTAHYSSVSFWTWNRLDQIKVITRAHPCHHYHNTSLKHVFRPFMRLLLYIAFCQGCM